jgi:predicted branched-subunit amino acid permease
VNAPLGSATSPRSAAQGFPTSISVASGLTVGQTMVLSLVMFTGASQFAFVGVAAVLSRRYCAW